jgi:multidrug efflux pump subunit AcrA (membrane-fusion protein)
MNRSVFALVFSACVALALVPASSSAESVAQEAAEHPRIAKAVQELEEVIRYLEAAPHDFGGHKAAAIHASRKAIEQLRLALRYRAIQDTKKGR